MNAEWMDQAQQRAQPLRTTLLASFFATDFGFPIGPVYTQKCEDPLAGCVLERWSTVSKRRICGKRSHKQGEINVRLSVLGAATASKLLLTPKFAPLTTRPAQAVGFLTPVS